MSLSRLFNTIKYLKPIQIISRFTPFTKTGYKKFHNVHHINADLFIDGLHNNSDYLNRFAFKGDLINILNQEIELDYSKLNSLPPLINYNVQYFEYGIVWAQTGCSFNFIKEKWNEYLKCTLPLEPYVVSLQLINMVIAMQISKVDDSQIYDEIYSRYRWLLRHQEKHLLANHYFENLKTIVVLSYIFSERNIFDIYINKLKKECREQILDDGFHFELSPMYHKLVLEDLLLVSRVYSSDWLDKTIIKMSLAINSLENGAPRTLLFNDSGDNVAKPLSAIVKTIEKLYNIKLRDDQKLLSSGFCVFRNSQYLLAIDAGTVGPNYNPGHAHCDCLSFELFRNSKSVFVNCGTFCYQGDKRPFFRSTKAHNTIMISNHEQSDCWGEHRVAKRIKKVSFNRQGNTFFGSYTNCYGEIHERKIDFDFNTLSVLDKCKKTKKNAIISSFLHLAPGFDFKDNCIYGNDCCFKLQTTNCTVEIVESVYSPEFGSLHKIKCLVFKWNVDSAFHGYTIFLNKEINIYG